MVVVKSHEAGIQSVFQRQEVLVHEPLIADPDRLRRPPPVFGPQAGCGALKQLRVPGIREALHLPGTVGRVEVLRRQVAVNRDLERRQHGKGRERRAEPLVAFVPRAPAVAQQGGQVVQGTDDLLKLDSPGQGKVSLMGVGPPQECRRKLALVGEASRAGAAAPCRRQYRQEDAQQ